MGFYGRSSLILWKVIGIDPQRLLRKSELESFFFLPNRFLSRRWMTAHLGPPQVVAETWQHLSSDRGRPLSDAQSLECNFRCGYGSKFKTWGTTDIVNSWYQASNYWGTQFWPVPYPCVLIGKVKFQTMISRWWLTLWLCKGTGCCCCSGKLTPARHCSHDTRSRNRTHAQHGLKKSQTRAWTISVGWFIVHSWVKRDIWMVPPLLSIRFRRFVHCWEGSKEKSHWTTKA